MADREFEQKLSEFCSPTILGQKAAGMLSLDEREFRELPGLLAIYNRKFSACGIRFRILRQYKGRDLVFVYRPDLLAGCLKDRRTRSILTACGYPETGDLGLLLGHLSDRLKGNARFPHEIGAFLDYPPEDVEGFIRHRGRNFKLCGCWKVYGDVTKARERFARFEECRNRVRLAMKNGTGLSGLLLGNGPEQTQAYAAA